MSTVFLDTVGLIAQWDTTDQWHALAEAAYRQIKTIRKPVLTTTFILLECGNTAARRTFRCDVCALRQALELRNELIVPTGDDWKQAWADYEQGLAGQAGIIDHVSFVVMRRLGIKEAFTNIPATAFYKVSDGTRSLVRLKDAPDASQHIWRTLARTWIARKLTVQGFRNGLKRNG
jgi:predicted nucleic acid-binding protein